MTSESAAAGLSLVPYNDPVLHRRAAAVPLPDPGLGAVVDAMFEAMYAAEGVGLAAPQVGLGLSLFVYDCPDADGRRRSGYVVNPTLAPRTGAEELDEAVEGCLSLPGLHAVVGRAGTAIVVGQDVTGAPVTVEGDGLLARCLQHETDHLEGRLYVSRLRARERRRLLDGLGAGR